MIRLPLWPTLLVALTCAAMIGLGVWQLRRADEKAALLERYRVANTLPEMAFPAVPNKTDLPLFRKARGLCLRPTSWSAKAGRNLKGESGWVHIARCATGAEGPGLSVEVGWSRNPSTPGWSGGPVAGVITTDSTTLIRLVSRKALAPGLERSAPPSMADVPNNHLSYAIQWFAFAVIAVAIYAIALLARQTDRVAARPRTAPPARATIQAGSADDAGSLSLPEPAPNRPTSAPL